MINNLEWKVFFMWILCCHELGQVLKIWRVTFLVVAHKDKFAIFQGFVINLFVNLHINGFGAYQVHNYTHISMTFTCFHEPRVCGSIPYNHCPRFLHGLLLFYFHTLLPLFYFILFFDMFVSISILIFLCWCLRPS